MRFGQSGQRIVVRHVDDPLVGQAPFRDLGFEAGVRARELLGARLDAPLERPLHLAQRLLAELALAILAAYHDVGVTDEDEHDQLQHTDDDRPGQGDLPLHVLDSRDERRDVVVDLDDRRDGGVGGEPDRNERRQDVGVIDRAIECAEPVAMRELAGGISRLGRREARVRALVIADLVRRSRVERQAARVDDLELHD